MISTQSHRICHIFSDTVIGTERLHHRVTRLHFFGKENYKSKFEPAIDSSTGITVMNLICRCLHALDEACSPSSDASGWAMLRHVFGIRNHACTARLVRSSSSVWTIEHGCSPSCNIQHSAMSNAKGEIRNKTAWSTRISPAPIWETRSRCHDLYSCQGCQCFVSDFMSFAISRTCTAQLPAVQHTYRIPVLDWRPSSSSFAALQVACVHRIMVPLA